MWRQGRQELVVLPVNADKDQGGFLGCFCVGRHLKGNARSDACTVFRWTAPRSCGGYLGPLRHGAAAVGSAAAVHHPVPRLEQAQAQGATQVPRPEDAHHLRGARGAHRMQSHAVWPHISLHSHVY